jgi:hypothetical protein
MTKAIRRRAGDIGDEIFVVDVKCTVTVILSP